MMMMLAMIGLLIIGGAVGYGVWKLVNGVTFRKTTDRYQYRITKDEHGNEITEVIDVNDKETKI